MARTAKAMMPKPQAGIGSSRWASASSSVRPKFTSHLSVASIGRLPARSSPAKRSGSAHLTVAHHHVLGGGHLRQPHRAAGVQLLGGDADLGAEAELAAVDEPAGGVH